MSDECGDGYGGQSYAAMPCPPVTEAFKEVKVLIRKASGFLMLVMALSLLLVTAPALAIGLGVSPEKLNIEVSRGCSTTATLNVINTGSDESSYKVYVEEEDYVSWFTVETEEFTLPAGARKPVQITISPPQDASGQHEAHICVVSLPLDGDLAIGTGIKVPTYIHILGMARLILPVSIGVALVAIAIIVYIVWRKRRARMV